MYNISGVDELSYMCIYEDVVHMHAEVVKMMHQSKMQIFENFMPYIIVIWKTLMSLV